MDLNVDRLIEAIRSVGCDAKQQGTEYYIMMPGNFPWYGDKDVHEIVNSRIVASISDALNNFNYEQVTNWLHNKICEVSNKAKEYRRMLLEYQSKDYEV